MGDPNEVELMDFLKAVIEGKWIVVGFTVLLAITSAGFALSLPNMYKSTVVLAPAESSGAGGLAKLAGQFGGLASLAGISLRGGGANKTEEALEILRSWAFIEEFIEKEEIAPKVFAAKGWSSETKDLIFDPDIYDPRTETWTRKNFKGKNAEPSSWELYKKFSSFLSLEENRGSSFTFLSVEYYSPSIAKSWANKLVYRLNEKLRQKDAKEAEKNIEFLRRKINETSLSSMKAVFYSLVEDQTRTLMLASGEIEYALRVVSPARAPEEKSNPKRAFICLMGIFLGATLGVLIAILVKFKARVPISRS